MFQVKNDEKVHVKLGVHRRKKRIKPETMLLNGTEETCITESVLFVFLYTTNKIISSMDGDLI